MGWQVPSRPWPSIPRGGGASCGCMRRTQHSSRLTMAAGSCTWGTRGTGSCTRTSGTGSDTWTRRCRCASVSVRVFTSRMVVRVCAAPKRFFAAAAAGNGRNQNPGLDQPPLRGEHAAYQRGPASPGLARHGRPTVVRTADVSIPSDTVHPVRRGSAHNTGCWRRCALHLRFPRAAMRWRAYPEAMPRCVLAGDPLAAAIPREAQARWSSFPNVVWCVANDVTLEDAINTIGSAMAANEPWGTLIAT